MANDTQEGAAERALDRNCALRAACIQALDRVARMDLSFQEEPLIKRLNASLGEMVAVLDEVIAIIHAASPQQALPPKRFQ